MPLVLIIVTYYVITTSICLFWWLENEELMRVVDMLALLSFGWFLWVVFLSEMVGEALERWDLNRVIWRR